jgi:hypothetical protein
LEKSSLQNNRAPRRAIFVFVALIAAHAVNAQIGGLPGAYLRAPVGAAAFAMGGAQSASPEYACTWWNPAMLALVRQTQIDAGGGLRSLGRTEGFASLQFKITPRVGMGIFALYRGDGSLDNLYDENEQILEKGAFASYTAKIGLSYLAARKLSLGVNIAYYYQRLPSAYYQSSLFYSSASAMGGFDFAVRYTPTGRWALAAVVQNIDILKVLSGKSATVDMNWEIASGDNLNAAVVDKIVPTAVFASRYEWSVAGYPFFWNCDLHAYVTDGDFTKLDLMEIRLNNGVEWKRWSRFVVRAGLGDMLLNRNVWTNSQNFSDEFAPRVSLGFGADLVRVHRGLRFNYGIATDRTGAGVDQQVEFSYSF